MVRLQPTTMTSKLVPILLMLCYFIQPHPLYKNIDLKETLLVRIKRNIEVAKHSEREPQADNLPLVWGCKKKDCEKQRKLRMLIEELHKSTDKLKINGKR